MRVDDSDIPFSILARREGICRDTVRRILREAAKKTPVSKGD
jgi:hypothetical protein